MEANERHDRGRQHVAAVINYWLQSSGLSHAQAVAISRWEAKTGYIQSSQLSKLRNGVLRTPFLKQFEGLAALNHGIARWHREGAKAARAENGPLPPEVTASAMDATVVLTHPEWPDEPLRFRDFCELFVGYMALPYVTDLSVSDSRAAAVSDAVGHVLEHYLARQGGLREGFRRLITHYPTTNQQRIDKLRDVVLGQAAWSPEELREESMALCTLLSSVTEREFTRGDLMALQATTGSSPVTPGTTGVRTTAPL